MGRGGVKKRGIKKRNLTRFRQKIIIPGEEYHPLPSRCPSVVEDDQSEDPSEVDHQSVHQEADSAPISDPDDRLRTRGQILEEEKNSSYSILNISQLTVLWNNAIKEHTLLHCDKGPKKKCPGAFEMERTQLWIISSAYRVICTKCQYKSESVDMFQKKEKQGKGRKPSTLNHSVGMALIQSRMGASGFHELLLILGINPGSKRGLHKLIQQCCGTVDTITKKTLDKQNRDLAKKFPDGINIGGDGRYNNKYSSSPFQAGTQCLYTTVELDTKDKKVLSVQIINQNCIMGKRRIRNGERPLCPDHPYCTATISRHTPISNEGEYAFAACESLKSQGLKVKTMTSDGDVKIDEGVKRSFPNADCLRDSIHVAKSQKNAIIAKQYSHSMFPGNEKERTKCKNWFAEDLRQRCSSELTRAERRSRKKGQTKEEKMMKMNELLRNVPSAIVKCYAGSHRECDKHSLICTQEERWGKRELVTGMHERLHMTREDRDLVEEVILKRLGPEAIAVTYLNSNTNKVESINSSYQKNVSKSITHGGQSVKGRAFVAVLQRNDGFASTSLACQAAVGHTVSRDIKRKMAEVDKEREYAKRRKTSKVQRQKRIDDRIAEKRYYEITGACAVVDPYSTGCALPQSMR